MFPVSRKNALGHMWTAPDVIPQICRTIELCPDTTWDSASDLRDLADALEAMLEENGARKEDFIWQMERHFSEPYGPLPPATITTHAGVPNLFRSGNDMSQWFALGYTPNSGRQE